MDISVADSRDNVGNDGAVAWEQRRAHGLPPVSSSLSALFLVPSPHNLMH